MNRPVVASNLVEVKENGCGSDLGKQGDDGLKALLLRDEGQVERFVAVGLEKGNEIRRRYRAVEEERLKKAGQNVDLILEVVKRNEESHVKDSSKIPVKVMSAEYHGGEEEEKGSKLWAARMVQEAQKEEAERVAMEASGEKGLLISVQNCNRVIGPVESEPVSNKGVAFEGYLRKKYPVKRRQAQVGRS